MDYRDFARWLRGGAWSCATIILQTRRARGLPSARTLAFSVFLLAAVSLTISIADSPHSAFVTQAQADASTIGQWSAVETWPVQATHAHLLPTGQVLFYPAWSQGDTPYLW